MILIYIQGGPKKFMNLSRGKVLMKIMNLAAKVFILKTLITSKLIDLAT